MTYTVVSLPAVKTDILNTVEYYKKISPAIARQFLIRLREASTFISGSPLGFQIKYKNTRTLLLKQFPYHIHYIINDDKKQIVIIGIIHAYKNPQDYTER